MQAVSAPSAEDGAGRPARHTCEGQSYRAVIARAVALWRDVAIFFHPARQVFSIPGVSHLCRTFPDFRGIHLV